MTGIEVDRKSKDGVSVDGPNGMRSYFTRPRTSVETVRCIVRVPTKYSVSTPGEVSFHVGAPIIDQLIANLTAFRDEIEAEVCWVQEQEYEAKQALAEWEEEQQARDAEGGAT